jgi:hypothetical protein
VSDKKYEEASVKMVQKAIEKLRSEMDSNRSNAYIQAVGQYLINHVDTSSAEKILKADKSIAKSLDAMRSEASKKKVNNCAMFTPEEGFAIVMKYYGISGTPTVQTAPISRPAPAAPAPAPIAAKVDDFDLKLEDLLL